MRRPVVDPLRTLYRDGVISAYEKRITTDHLYKTEFSVIFTLTDRPAQQLRCFNPRSMEEAVTAAVYMAKHPPTIVEDISAAFDLDE